MDMEQVARRMALPDGGDLRFFEASDKIRIRYGVWRAPAPGGAGTVFVLPGRTEFIEKYAETIADLLQRGFAVVCMDWRNQGLSGRPLENRSKHHCDSFDAAIADLGDLFRETRQDHLPRPYVLLGHSMGAHFALRYLHDHPEAVDRAVFSAPMVDIQTRPFSPGAARLMARTACAFGFGTAYAPMQTDYGALQRGPITMKMLTSDADRFMSEHRWIDQNPELALGGITYGWLCAAFRSIETLNAPGYPEAITTPILIVQAGKDPLINNGRQKTFAERLPNGSFKCIDGALHELLNERDDIRDQFWRCFDDFVRG